MHKIIIPFLIIFSSILIYLNYNNYWTTANHSKELIQFLDENVVVNGVISSIPQQYAKRKSVNFIIKTSSINGCPINKSIYVDIHQNSNRPLKYGMDVELKGVLKRIAADNVYLKRYLYRNINFILESSRFNAYEILDYKIGARRIVSSLRDFVVNNTLNVNKGEARGFLVSIILGEKQYFENNDLKILRANGFAHIMAVSGMHIALLLYIILALFGGVRSKSFYITAFIFIWVYTGMSGFSPSVMRATVMIMFVFGGYIFKRDYNSSYALLWTCLFMLIFTPGLLFDVGFQLSFTATFGIIYYYNFLMNKLVFIPKFLRAICAVNIGAYFATFPIVLFYFGRVSTLSLILNIFCGILLLIAICLNFISIIMSFAWIELANIFSSINYFFIHIFLDMNRKIFNAGISNIEISGIDFMFFVVYYFCFLGIPKLDIIRSKEKYVIAYLGLALALLMFVIVYPRY